MHHLHNSHAFFFVVIFSLLPSAFAEMTALDEYVAAPDPAYSWTLTDVQPIEGDLGTMYTVSMTSQQWRTSADVNRSVWQHVLNIVTPINAASDLAFLIVEGGSNTSPPTDISEYAFISYLAGCTVALLQTVPNQPLRFYDPNTTNLSEDHAIGHTYDRYLNLFVEGEPHPDPTWPLLLPMVKSAVRAMDTIQDCLAQQEGKDITRFVVGGASKRGWTTWLTAAVDSRVVGIVPVVIDILNMDRQLEHHKNAYGAYPATSSTYYTYGGYSTAIQPYTQRNIFSRLDTPAGESLQKIVDPYYYRDRLTMPKLIVNSTGDQFFLPDGIMFYFNQIPGDNYLYYAPNTDHGLGFTEGDYGMIFGLLNFVKSFLPGNRKMPNFSWKFEADGSIRVDTISTPNSVYLWQAHTPDHRDFRLRTMGAIWQQSPLNPQDKSGTYIASVPDPTQGWTGFYVQLNFGDISVCSGLRVLPESYANGAPYPDTYGPEFSLQNVTPALAGTDTPVEIVFSASETLSAAPEVWVNDHAASYVSHEDNIYVYAYILTDADPEGNAVIQIKGSDADDNPGSATFSESLTIDNTPPQCIGLTVTPASARPGETVFIAFDVSETLAANPLVYVNGRLAAPFGEKDAAYVFYYVVTESDTLGPATLAITLMDEAANTVQISYSNLFVVLKMLPISYAAIMAGLVLIMVSGAVAVRNRKSDKVAIRQ